MKNLYVYLILIVFASSCITSSIKNLNKDLDLVNKHRNERISQIDTIISLIDNKMSDAFLKNKVPPLKPDLQIGNIPMDECGDIQDEYNRLNSIRYSDSIEIDGVSREVVILKDKILSERASLVALADTIIKIKTQIINSVGDRKAIKNLDTIVDGFTKAFYLEDKNIVSTASKITVVTENKINPLLVKLRTDQMFVSTYNSNFRGNELMGTWLGNIKFESAKSSLEECDLFDAYTLDGEKDPQFFLKYTRRINDAINNVVNRYSIVKDDNIRFKLILVSFGYADDHRALVLKNQPGYEKCRGSNNLNYCLNLELSYKRATTIASYFSDYIKIDTYMFGGFPKCIKGWGTELPPLKLHQEDKDLYDKQRRSVIFYVFLIAEKISPIKK